jgi:predicted metal-dependent phosphoesterase TrpH
MRLKIDLHVHTTGSKDSFIEPEQLPVILKNKGLDGVAITNHDAPAGFSSSEVIIIPGIEVSTRQGHILALGVSGRVERKRPVDETIRLIQSMGGVAVVPHPFDPVSPCVNLSKLNSRPDAVEVINSDALFFGLNTKYAMSAARRLGLPMVAGSDSHIPETVGDAYTLVDSSSNSINDILNAIRAGSVEPEGQPTSVSKKLLKWARTLRSL